MPEPVEAGDEPTPSSSPNVAAIFGRRQRADPEPVERVDESAEMSLHSWPWQSPSNVTVPIITVTNATVPAPGPAAAARRAAGRTPSTPSRVSKIDMRANMLK